jgi:hypothetical protein
MVAEQGLVVSLRQCARKHCFVSAAMFGHYKHGYGTPLSLLASYGLLGFLVVSTNEMTTVKFSFPHVLEIQE